MMNHLLLAASLALAAAPVARAASAVDDNFSDGSIGPQWSLLQDNPAALALAEQNGRLEVLSAPGGDQADDALYLSKFQLSTAADFSVAVDYDFAGSGSNSAIFSSLALDFGVGRDLDGTDSAAIALGRVGGVNLPAALGVAHRTDDVQTTDYGPTLQLLTAGTFLLSYDAAGDDLSIGLDGQPPLFTLQDTVRGVWGADSLYVSFGARGSGFTTASGDASLDNFAVRSGTLTDVPEPASVGLVGLAAVGFVRRRR